MKEYLKMTINTRSTFLILMTISSLSLPVYSFANTVTANTKQIQITDDKKLHNLWVSYQDTLFLMDKALDKIKTETDDNKRNAIIATYIQRLTQIRNTLNSLILTTAANNKFRQHMIEHTTKYQNVYQLAALTKPTEQQRNMFTRLNEQTADIYGKMVVLAKKIN